MTTNKNTIAGELATHYAKMGLKVLVFVSDPSAADATAHKISIALNDERDNFGEFIEENKGAIQQLSQELGGFQFSYLNSAALAGSHHGHLLPLERQLIENYFKRKNGCNVLVATATLAQGINLPAEIVIISGDDRYNKESGRETVLPHELLNAAGRAGRAGQSSQGAVILIPSDLVTMEDEKISPSWWKLKNDVFSKSDQCLTVKDPLEAVLDSLQDDAIPLSYDQVNVLYRFRSEEAAAKNTEEFFSKSLLAFRYSRNNLNEEFKAKVVKLIKRRNSLDQANDNIDWVREASFKTGIDPHAIFEIGNAVQKIGLQYFFETPIIDLVDWFISWLAENSNLINKLFTKEVTISYLVKILGVDAKTLTVDSLCAKFPTLKLALVAYVEGKDLSTIEGLLKGKKSTLNVNARIFVNKIIPELSFVFGLLTIAVIEKAKLNGISKKELPKSIKSLSSCIREGFDDITKLYYKYNNSILTRIRTHEMYNSDPLYND